MPSAIAIVLVACGLTTVYPNVLRYNFLRYGNLPSGASQCKLRGGECMFSLHCHTQKGHFVHDEKYNNIYCIENFQIKTCCKVPYVGTTNSPGATTESHKETIHPNDINYSFTKSASTLPTTFKDDAVTETTWLPSQSVSTTLVVTVEETPTTVKPTTMFTKPVSEANPWKFPTTITSPITILTTKRKISTNGPYTSEGTTLEMNKIPTFSPITKTTSDYTSMKTDSGTTMTKPSENPSTVWTYATTKPSTGWTSPTSNPSTVWTSPTSNPSTVSMDPTTIPITAWIEPTTITSSTVRTNPSTKSPTKPSTVLIDPTTKQSTETSTVSTNPPTTKPSTATPSTMSNTLLTDEMTTFSDPTTTSSTVSVDPTTKLTRKPSTVSVDYTTMFTSKPTTVSVEPTTIPSTTTTEQTTEIPTTTVEATSSSTSTTTSPITVKPTDQFGYKDICGIPAIGPTGRIVGGKQAPYAKNPWLISLRQKADGTYKHKCGAALLTNSWAITAAHCIQDVKVSDMLLRIGEYDTTNTDEDDSHEERTVKLVIQHQLFDPRTYEYDLALIRLSKKIEFRRNIIPVCLPNSNHSFVGEVGNVAGWGRIYEGGPAPSVIQEVKVPVITNQACEAMYLRAGYREYIPDIFLCAGFEEGLRDSCEGDSGGPLVIKKDGRYTLAGIISWGIGCAARNQPGVYTNVRRFLGWITPFINID